MELDIYVPSIKFVVEYDGAAWYQAEEQHNRERRKYRMCKAHSITLVRVKEKTGKECDDVADRIYYVKKVKRNNLDEIENITFGV